MNPGRSGAAPTARHPPPSAAAVKAGTCAFRLRSDHTQTNRGGVSHRIIRVAECVGQRQNGRGRVTPDPSESVRASEPNALVLIPKQRDQCAHRRLGIGAK